MWRRECYQLFYLFFLAEFPNCAKVVEGTCIREGQAHFPLECQITRVIPLEDGYEVNTATQWPAETQASIAQVLGISVNS